MVGKIDKNGVLFIERKRNGKKEFIRCRCINQLVIKNQYTFQYSECSDKCVFFGELVLIQDRTDEHYLILCNKRLVFESLIDERE